MLNPTAQQFGRGRMGLAGSGMQVDERIGGVMVMSIVVWVRSAIWVWETQVGGRMGEGMVISIVVYVRSALWVGEMQFGRRTSGGW